MNVIIRPGRIVIEHGQTGISLVWFGGIYVCCACFRGHEFRKAVLSPAVARRSRAKRDPLRWSQEGLQSRHNDVQLGR